MLAQLLLPALCALALGASARPAPLTKRYQGVWIVSGRDGKCLAAAPKTGYGSEVNTVDCAETAWVTLWDIDEGSGSVLLHGTELALDAGENPVDGGALKVWTSYPGLYQQTWYLTPDNRIAITGGTQCLDEGDDGAQVWTCTTGDDNQVWYVQGPYGTSPSPDSSAVPPSTTTTVDVFSSVSSPLAVPTTVVFSSSGPAATAVAATTLSVSSAEAEPTTVVFSSSGPAVTAVAVTA